MGHGPVGRHRQLQRLVRAHQVIGGSRTGISRGRSDAPRSILRWYKEGDVLQATESLLSSCDDGPRGACRAFPARSSGRSFALGFGRRSRCWGFLISHAARGEFTALSNEEIKKKNLPRTHARVPSYFTAGLLCMRPSEASNCQRWLSSRDAPVPRCTDDFPVGMLHSRNSFPAFGRKGDFHHS